MPERLWKPGDRVRTLTEGGVVEAIVVEGAHMDGEFEVITICSPEDWELFQAGGKPGGYWEEWKFPWPVESVEAEDT